MPDETNRSRLIRLLSHMTGRPLENGGLIVKVTDDGKDRLVLRTDAEGDRPLEEVEELELADILCQLRGHSGW